jgi:hypothetical protein
MVNASPMTLKPRLSIGLGYFFSILVADKATFATRATKCFSEYLDLYGYCYTTIAPMLIRAIRFSDTGKRTEVYS